MKKNSVLSGGLALVVGAIVGGTTVKCLNKPNDCEEKLEKYRGYYDLLNKWLMLKEENKSIVKYFEEKKYKNIAIYGIGEIGKHLYNELEDTDINIKYAIDKYGRDLLFELPVFRLDDNWDKVDAIVVTTPFIYDEVKGMLKNKIDYDIISIEEVLFGCE